MMTNDRSQLRNFITRWLVIGFILRFVLMLLIHFTGADKSLGLTKDGFLYDKVGLELAEYLRTGDPAYWPSRLQRFTDFGWEFFVGVVYFFAGHQPVLVKLFCVIVGTITPLIHYRTALLVTGDQRVAKLALVLSILFPTQVYYSTLMVRDSLATMGVSLVFLAITEYTSRAISSRWMLHGALGMAIVVSLRSYLAAILCVTIPLGFLAASMFSGVGGSESRGKLALAGVILAAVLAGVIGFAPEMLSEIDTQFADLSYINKIRRKMNQGSGAFFQSGNVTEIGEDVTGTAVSFGVGIYFFFFSINPSSLNTIRQFMALPEVVLVAVGAIYSIRGAKVLWNERRYVFTVLMVPTFVITVGYSVATTNGGPLMRWRMQLLGVYLIMAATGLMATRLRKTRQTAEPLRSKESNAEAA